MELVPGVAVHFIQSKKFKTNKITVRFTAPLSLEIVPGRMLNANILEIANQIYPTAQRFRKHLATLYGTDLSVSAYRRGQCHLFDITITFVRDEFLSKKNVLTGQILEVLNQILFAPLVNHEAFEKDVFTIEQQQLLARLKSEIEDPFYFAHKKLDQLVYSDESMQLSPETLIDCILKETPESSFSSFQKMLTEDKIDFFFLGKFNEIEVIEELKQFPFTGRQQTVNVQYHQEYSNILKEGIDRKSLEQSILEMGYHTPIGYDDDLQMSLIVANGLLGAFPHSKLFTQVREKYGLAYTVSSELDLFTGVLRLYAGIDRKDRNKARKLMNDQLLDLKSGKFTDSEIAQTKQMIRRLLIVAQDSSDSIIDRLYLNTLFEKHDISQEDLLQRLDRVDRESITKAVNSVKLQAIYFMEGAE